MNLLGVHDREGAHLVPPGGWCVDTVALSESPTPVDYLSIRSDINWLVRLNWGYGSTGTIPAPNEFALYVTAASLYAAQSRGVYAFILGNEPNHEQERPNGIYISPEHYSELYNRTFTLLKKQNSNTRVMPAPVAPYHANPLDFRDYAQQVLASILDCDGIPIHAYARGTVPAAIRSEGKMGGMLGEAYNSFRTYRDILGIAKEWFPGRPGFITEFDELEAWRNENTGIIQEAVRELQEWNRDNPEQPVFSLVLYRYPNYDRWGFQNKQAVIEDFRAAIEIASLNNVEAPRINEKHKTVLPYIPNENEGLLPPLNSFERQIDERSGELGISVVEVNDTDRPVWKVKSIRWYNEQESDGLGPDRHLLIDTLDEEGNRVVGVPLLVSWSTGNDTIVSEEKRGERWSANFAFTPGRNAFSVLVQDGKHLSEMVRGLGMGADTPSGFNPGIHTSTEVIFQLVKEPTVPLDLPPEGEKEDTAAPTRLVHPVQEPAYRRITQPFGVNGDYYKRFSVDGVLLQGHNGIDYGTPVGTAIQAVDAGQAVEVASDPDGYGLYIKLVHQWGESLYAHLSEQLLFVGQRVVKGERIGYSGNTGNSTGPHLHFGIRVKPYNRRDGWGGYSNPAPFLVAAGDGTSSSAERPDHLSIKQIIKQVAKETGLEWELLASLAWAESSFRAEIPYGLFQVEDPAWHDFAPKVGATDRHDALDNARVAAAYLLWLLPQVKNNEYQMLVAYNFGIGRVLKGEKPPPITLEYVNKVMHGRDLLKAVGL